MSGRRWPLEILWEDRWLLAVSKPEGLPVISPEGSRARSLYDLVTDHIRRTDPRGRAALVHRIDRDTSGLVLFARDGRTKKAMMDHWDDVVRERIYAAVVVGRPPAEEGRMEDWLRENRAGELYPVPAGSRDAKIALASWKLLDGGSGRSLLDISIETGRKHQIRVQLASRGMPVLGDPRYGRADPRSRADRLYLHARRIAFRHPYTDKDISLDCPLPPCFRQALGPDQRPSRLRPR